MPKSTHIKDPQTRAERLAHARGCRSRMKPFLDAAYDEYVRTGRVHRLRALMAEAAASQGGAE